MRVVAFDRHVLVDEFVERTPRHEAQAWQRPRLALDPACRELEDFGFESIEVAGYDPHPAIRAPIAV